MMKQTILRRLVLTTSLGVALSMTSGCGSDDGGGGGLPGIEEFVSDLRVSGRDDLVAELMPGTPPVQSGGPAISAPDAATVNPGLTVGPVPITSEEVFSRLILEIPGSSGFWVLNFGDLGNGGGAGTGMGTDLNVDVTFGANPPDANFDCLFSGSEGESGPVGPAETTTITIEDCTVLDFCEERCDPVEAIACTQYCSLVDVLPSCLLEANAPLVCGAIFSCLDSETCSAAGQCAEEETSGAISASCAQDTCEAVESLP
jgi:hypothetical protein